MLTRALLGAAALAALGSVASAQFYAPETLDGVRERMAPDIEAMVREDIVALTPRALRPAAAGIAIRFPERGRHPLDFFSAPGRDEIYAPLESVRFLADLAILMAWFERRGCDATAVGAYLSALLRRREPLPAPLDAFAIDRDAALADPWVDDVSGKVLKSAMLFILAHEVGHVVLAHGAAQGAASQAQEIAADAFALDAFAALGQSPSGMVVYFAAAQWFDVRGPAAALRTHPVSADRLRAIADALEARTDSFAHSEPDFAAAAAQTRFIAANVATMGEVMAQMDLDLLAEAFAMQYPPSRFASACPG